MDDLWRRHRSEKFNETPGKEGRREGKDPTYLGLSRIEISDREQEKEAKDRPRRPLVSYVFQQPRGGVAPLLCHQSSPPSLLRGVKMDDPIKTWAYIISGPKNVSLIGTIKCGERTGHLNGIGIGVGH